MEEQKKILNRAYLAVAPFAVVALAVLVKLFYIQYGEGVDLRAQSQQEVLREVPIPAERGNIYSVDAHLLATSMPVYDLHFDALTAEQSDFNAGLDSLAQALAAFLGGRSRAEWRAYLAQARQGGNRYLAIAENLSYSQLQRVKEMPIFRLGKYAGGLIYEQENTRKKPLGKIAERTIGRDRRYSSTGLEGAYSALLAGKDGSRIKQKVSNGHWKPVTDNYEQVPEDGYDLISTIDTRMQDVAHHELLKALERFEADHGCAVLMESKTGAIRAIANLGRTKEGTYFEKRNYAVWESTEPGSTFKLASVMAALEDGVADTNTKIDTENGQYLIYNRKIRDSNGKGYGTISLKRAFEVSSNVGIVKLIYDQYKDQPERFTDRLYTLGLHKTLNLPIKGEGIPKIPKPGDPAWSGISLPWMAFGYQVSLTPLQLLTFYNAVANDGVMVKPQFIQAIRKHGRPISAQEPEVLNPAICSESTLKKLQDLLEGVVTQGTATNIQSDRLPLAGKTGTCQLNYWRSSTNDYQASFVGYFPANDPQYSCVVVINKPNYHRGYYGSTVAAPVFKAIAEHVYANTPVKIEALRHSEKEIWSERAFAIKTPLQGKWPDLRGHNGREVLSLLENQGFEVKIQGNGKVIWQYPQAGSPVDEKQLVELKLG